MPLFPFVSLFVLTAAVIATGLDPAAGDETNANLTQRSPDGPPACQCANEGATSESVSRNPHSNRPRTDRLYAGASGFLLRPGPSSLGIDALHPQRPQHGSLGVKSTPKFRHDTLRPDRSLHQAGQQQAKLTHFTEAVFAFHCFRKQVNTQISLVTMLSQHRHDTIVVDIA